MTSPPPRVAVRRRPDRAAYDAEAVAAVLDAGFLCHVAAVRDGRPVVLPTLYARDGDRILLHGSSAAGLFRDLTKSPAVRVAVTHVDGLVLARSAFRHSVNYRSAVVHGQAVEVTGEDDKRRALRLLLDRVVPGQWEATRQPSAAELRQTAVWSVPLGEASVKIRTGPPGDSEADLGLPVWAGVLPLGVEAGVPVPDGHVPAGMAVPRHLVGWRSLTHLLAPRRA
jgi:nitroimidazol reductase NimA-like FMN-containing flavoprotein (pyridoxamine 5'-phosphate oxidase superfamily)